MIETYVGIINAPELEALVSLNDHLADAYQAIADNPEERPETRRTAAALAAWRRGRARYFSEELAHAERLEAAHERVVWAS